MNGRVVRAISRLRRSIWFHPIDIVASNGAEKVNDRADSQVAGLPPGTQ